MSYAEFDLESIESSWIAPKPQLHPLTPCGVGTGLVESMTSYCLRLAHDHRVPLAQVERFVSDQGEALYTNMSGQPSRLDAPSAAAKEFARRLAEHTRQPSVARLGWGWLHEVWAPPQSFKDHFAWCPACIGEMETPYLPLLWSLKSCTHCPKHRFPLVSTCAACGHTQSVRRVPKGAIHECGSCRAPLAMDHRFSFASEPSRFDPPGLSDLTLELLGDFNARPDVTVHRPDVDRLIESAVDMKHAPHAAGLARMAGISKGTLASATDASHNPTPEVLLRLCIVSKFPPGALFGLRDASHKKPGYSLAYSSSDITLPEQRRTKRHDWYAIRKALFAAMQDLDNVPTVAQFAARYEVCPRQLREAWPGMTDALARLSKKSAQRATDRLVDALAQNLIESADRLRASGRKATARALADDLGVRRESTVFKAALARVRADEKSESEPTG